MIKRSFPTAVFCIAAITTLLSGGLIAGCHSAPDTATLPPPKSMWTPGTTTQTSAANYGRVPAEYADKMKSASGKAPGAR